MSALYAIGLIAAIGLCIYLLLALFYPERFT